MTWGQRSRCSDSVLEASSAVLPRKASPTASSLKGASPLVAKDITVPDLRAGFAYVMAAALASGTSKISGLHFLDRGYENLA